MPVRVAPPHDALAERLETVLALFAHNAAVAFWPLALLALRWDAIPVARRFADALLAAHLLSHGALVGGAIGAHPELWRYLPHLPIEWLALALPVAAWTNARRHAAVQRTGAITRTVVLTTAALAAAACLETYAVPFR